MLTKIYIYYNNLYLYLFIVSKLFVLIDPIGANSKLALYQFCSFGVSQDQAID
jgi:hypothetical protein